MSDIQKNLILIAALGVVFLALWHVFFSVSETENRAEYSSRAEAPKAEPSKVKSVETRTDRKTAAKPVVSESENDDRKPQAVDDERYLKFLNERAQQNFRILDDQYGSRGVMGPQIPLPMPNRNGAFELANEIAEAYGLPAGSIVDTGIESRGTKLTQPYQFQQQSHGYKVFDSYLRLQVKKEDQTVYMIVNQLQKVPENLSVSLNYTLQQATDIARTTYESEGVFRVIPMQEEPVIYTLDDGKFDLAWHLVTEVSQAESFTVLVSASSGEILNKFPNHSH
jgi:hypothetical protein